MFQPNPLFYLPALFRYREKEKKVQIKERIDHKLYITRWTLILQLIDRNFETGRLFFAKERERERERDCRSEQAGWTLFETRLNGGRRCRNRGVGFL